MWWCVPISPYDVLDAVREMTVSDAVGCTEESLVDNQMEYSNRDLVLDRGGATLSRLCAEEHDVSCD